MAEFWRSATMPRLEARRSCRENSCYRPHTHDVLSIGIIDAGDSVLSGPLTGPVRLAPGDVVVIPARQVHACNPDRSRWLYQMLHVDQDWAASLAGRAASPSASAVPSPATDEGTRVLRCPDLHHRASALIALLFSEGRIEAVEAGLADLLTTLSTAAPRFTAPSTADRELLALLRPVLDRLRDDPTNPPEDELAALAGMSRYQLVRAVKRATGLSPLAWRQNARIGRARSLLRDGMPIAEAASSLGFADQSHFHRVFRSHVAATPGAYRG